MAINLEATSHRIILTIDDFKGDEYLLQRAFYRGREWKTFSTSGFIAVLPTKTDEDLENTEDSDNIIEENNSDILSFSESTENEVEETKIVLLEAGDFIDSYDLENGLYEYRYIPFSVLIEKFGIASIEDLTQELIDSIEGDLWTYSEWVRFGNTGAIGYTFGNYSSPEGEWGTPVTADDCRYTYLWGTDFKAANGDTFTDEQIQFFVDEAIRYMERQLNLTIKKRVIRCNPKQRKLVKTTKAKKGDYDDEESPYDFSFRKIQRYGMITTLQRPIIEVERLDLVYRGNEKNSLLDDTVIDYKKGIIKFLKRPYKVSQRFSSISNSLEMYGDQTFNPHMFYEIDYTAGYENSDDMPEDLRQIIGKVAAVSLLNIIGDGLMSGFSSSSLSMDGISESFSSTQSATSAYFGARIQVYKDDIKAYIMENKYKFSNRPIGVL